MRRSLPLAALFLAPACTVQPPAAPPTASVATAPSPAPTPAAADWRDWPLTVGAWHYRQAPPQSDARYAPTGVAVVCRGDRTVQIRLPEVAAGLPVTIRTTSQTRTLVAQVEGGASAMTLPAHDRLLDAIAFSRGRFTLERPNAAPLVLPAHAEVGRVIQDCRGGGA